MPTQSPNEAGYNGRLEFVNDLFNKILGIAPVNVEVIAYDKECPFPYNNFIFIVTIQSPADAADKLGDQPGTVPIPPSGLPKFVVRLPNSQSSYNHEIRVENEVAALQLARQALNASSYSDIVPRVFAWGSAAGGQQGWMLQEHMPGVTLVDEFPKLPLDDQRSLLGQMADILKAFQEFKIPTSIRGYGGLTFDDAGTIVIGLTSIMNCGPFDTYDEVVLGTMRSKLNDADKNKVIQGWTQNNIRPRLEKFLESGVKTLMADFKKDGQRLVHGDLSTDNLLFDPSQMRITGLLDFDFGHIGTVADDFLCSFGRGTGQFPDHREGDETLPLHQAMLTSFPEPLPASTEDINWPQAKMWDDALRERHMRRPGNILGMKALSSMFWLSA